MKTSHTNKFLGLELKDLNDKTGQVAFYFGSFKKDLDNETIDKGAYAQTLKDTSHVYHNRDHEDAVGKPISFGVDDKGAYCVSQLAIKTIHGNDCYEQYKAGIIKGHSQEFVTTSEGKAADGSRLIKILELWGVTSVTNIPASLDTPTISVKSFAEVADHLEKINLLLKSGNISDKLGAKFMNEYAALSELVEKNKTMANYGIVHCDSCKAAYDTMPEDGKCYKCGQFIFKTPVKPMVTMEAIKNWKV
jgi:HK97 family phage prohead protease